MGFTAMAVTIGLVVGVATGGRLRHLGERQFHWWGLLVVGVFLQLPFVDRLGFAGLLLSYVLLLGFAIANLRLIGMALVVIGISPILYVPGVTLVGWLPPELQSYIVFTGSSARQPCSPRRREPS